MPVGVNTELVLGTSAARGIKTPEPHDVADAIVEALQTGRYEVYVPKRMNAMARLGALLPLRARDAINSASGGDVMTHPNSAARAAYEERIRRGLEASPGSAPAAAAAAPAPPAETPEPPAAETSTPEAPPRLRPRTRPRRSPPTATTPRPPRARRKPSRRSSSGHGRETGHTFPFLDQAPLRRKPVRDQPADLGAGVLLEEVAGVGDHVVDLGPEHRREPFAGLLRQHRVRVGPQDQLGPRV